VKAGIRTSSTQHEIEAKEPGMNDAFMNHIDECDFCCWVTSQFCAKARSLLDATAERAAAKMMPIPVLLPRHKVKA
jgi:hypothetical protein